MYNFKIPEEMCGDLYRLREYCAAGSIAGQIRTAIENYLKVQENRIGTSIKDAADAIKCYKRDKF